MRHTPNIQLILVMGHENCGAVDATLKALMNESAPAVLNLVDEYFATELAIDKATHILNLVEAIAPNVKDVFDKAGLTAANVKDQYPNLLTLAIQANAWAIAKQLKADLAVDYHEQSAHDSGTHGADNQHGSTRYTLKNVPIYYGVYDFDSGVVEIVEPAVA